jgi:hypothetical protein
MTSPGASMANVGSDLSLASLTLSILSYPIRDIFIDRLWLSVVNQTLFVRSLSSVRVVRKSYPGSKECRPAVIRGGGTPRARASGHAAVTVPYRWLRKLGLARAANARDWE